MRNRRNTAKATKLSMVVAIGIFASLASCSSKDADPPPLLDDCEGANCKPAGGSGNGTQPPGSGGAGGGGDQTTVTISGTVVSTLDAGFLAVAAYTGGAVVKARGQGGAEITSEAAAGQFTIDDVAAGLNWFGLVDPHAAPALMPTLQPVVVDADDPQARLVGVDEQTFINVLYALQPTQIPLSSAGHAILFFVRDDTELVKGAKIQEWAHAETVAYDSASGYETADPPSEGLTGEQGTALLVNIPAVPYPGSSVTIRFELDGQQQTVAIQVASGYVTRAAIAVD